MRLTSLLLPMLLSSCLYAQDNSIVRKVDDHYNHLVSLKTRYSEHYTGMGMDRTETGTLTLKKPGRMRWACGSPGV